MCRIELTTPVSDRVTSQTVTGDDLSFQATYLHTASCFLPLGPPYDLGLVVIADDTLWLGKGKQKALVVDQSPLTQANRRRYMTKLIMAAGQDNKLATAHSETMVRSVRDRRPWSYF
ncbi:hypothetical protein T01_6980 [Trichinella spiralis]|uniref:Uncharacterized protein n=1 Tax=Trichinella spiralis TaxID=6334 RepID=A0A0V1BM38_TRISP|nr:hypothetical protein T01_6980 [Trichinella spiralis]